MIYGLILCLLLSSCMYESESSLYNYEFYYLNQNQDNASGDALVLKNLYLRETPEEITPLTLVQTLIYQGTDPDISSPFPSDLKVIKAEFFLPGVIDVHLTENYSELTGIHRTLANYAIVSTLSQLPTVQGVRIFVAGEENAAPPTLRQRDMVFTQIEKDDSFS